MVNILTEQNVVRSLATLKPTDIYIKPDLEGITAGDFKRTSETADRGVAATEALADRLRPLAVSEADYAAWSENIQLARREAPTVHEIQIAGLKRVNPAMVEQHLGIKPGDPVSPPGINDESDEDLWRRLLRERRLHAADDVRERNILRVTPLEKSWGPDYLRYGVSLDSNFTSDSSYTLRLAYQKTWLNHLGGEFVAFGEIGSVNRVGMDYYQPVDERQRYFLETNLAYGSQVSPIFQNDNKLAEYRVTQGVARLSGGINLGTLGQVRAGWEENWWNAKLDVGSPFLPDLSKRYGGWIAQADLDSTDRLYFPTTGWFSKVSLFRLGGRRLQQTQRHRGRLHEHGRLGAE
jgi:NTE family protein